MLQNTPVKNNQQSLIHEDIYQLNMDVTDKVIFIVNIQYC